MPLVAAGVGVVAVIVSGSLWRDLRSERLLNEQLRLQLAEARAAANVPHLQAPPVTQPVAGTPAPEPVPAAPARPSVPTVMTPMEQDAMNVSIRASTSGILDAALITATGGVSEQDLLRNPEYRKAEVLQLRMRLDQSNPGLAEAVGLSGHEASQLFEAMAEDQLKRTAEMAALRAAEGPTANLAAVLQRNPAENPVLVVLGEEKYAKYQDYTRNVRPALVQVAGIGSMLTAVGQPLSDAQARSLASAMLAEQQRQRQGGVAAPTVRTAARGLVEMLEESATRQDESNRRIMEAAAPFLGAAQLAAMRKQYDQEAASRRQTLESTRQREAATRLPP